MWYFHCPTRHSIMSIGHLRKAFVFQEKNSTEMTESLHKVQHAPHHRDLTNN